MRPCVLDISHHNEVVSWPAIRDAGIFGIIHKATQGSGMVDKTYGPRRRQAESAGLRWGAYAFADSSDPKVQADHFLGVARPDANTLLALDWEDNGTRTMSVSQARVFLERVMQKTGRPPAGVVIYGGNVLKEKIKSKEDMAFFSQFPLWLCQYGPKAKLPKGWSSYFLWQYSESGQISGMAADGRIDLNVHGGKDLAAEWAVCTVPVMPATITVTGAGASAPGAGSGGGNGSSLVIPAADPPKVTPKDVIAVSRKATWLVRFGHACKAVFGSLTLGALAEQAGIAKSTMDQVAQFVQANALIILITCAILGYFVVKYVLSLMAEDVNEGRYTPSGEA